MSWRDPARCRRRGDLQRSNHVNDEGVDSWNLLALVARRHAGDRAGGPGAPGLVPAPARLADWRPGRDDPPVLRLAWMAGQAIFLDWYQSWLGPYTHNYWMFLFVAWAAVSYGRHGPPGLAKRPQAPPAGCRGPRDQRDHNFEATDLFSWEKVARALERLGKLSEAAV